MGIAAFVVLCSFAVEISQSAVTFSAGRPYLSKPLDQEAELKCCYTTTDQPLQLSWVRSYHSGKKMKGLVPMSLSGNVSAAAVEESGKHCSILTLTSLQLNDSGLYQCGLNSTQGTILSHGTFLHVYNPLKKTLNIKESTKNNILIVEGILLLLCVLLPTLTLLSKSKKFNELQKKKAKAEQENIYQGLNLEDCSSTYDQIERSQAQGLYEDVCNLKVEEEAIQLEKP